MRNENVNMLIPIDCPKMAENSISTLHLFVLFFVRVHFSASIVIEFHAFGVIESLQCELSHQNAHLFDLSMSG